MKTFKNILVVMISALMVMGVFYGVSFAQEEEYDFEDNYTFVTVRAAYHAEMNEYFDEKIAGLVKLFEEGLGIEDPNFKAPGPKGNCDDDKNLSSFCVGMGALKRYEKYLLLLENVSKGISLEEGAATVDDVFTLTIKRNQEILKEKDEARKTLEAAVGIYDEFRLAYPVHMKYMETIKLLIKYRTKLQTWRQTISEFPGDFVDATSTKCE
jgi:hypothetical protein